ncbi:hypothetical protein N474_18050 [Pseudoalteromonas luteoviolacea CPMOR-2]|uniref:hypothetical protein n=1 Tax=Pseudoalteromonas luteoviolacea TaxID=43657 RepID=UPI0007B05468|nr:hypothetical protein [Pseudoalteromonas luteoviolacea]KZN54254.1 hypothetical protein N474_18050 [Pseudoalteromonas luteoviolacea CPMOR-2]
MKWLIAMFAAMWLNSTMAADCDSTLYDVSQAADTAKLYYTQQGVGFIAVADGIGPTRPAFEQITMSKCLVLETPWQMIWVGADSQSCPNQAKLEAKALDYARKFNQKMLKLARNDANFKCNLVENVNPVDSK